MYNYTNNNIQFFSSISSPVIGCLLSFNSNFEDKKSAGLCLIIVLWMMMMMTICIYKENYSLQNFQLMYGYYSLINVERKWKKIFWWDYRLKDIFFFSCSLHYVYCCKKICTKIKLTIRFKIPSFGWLFGIDWYIFQMVTHWCLLEDNLCCNNLIFIPHKMICLFKMIWNPVIARQCTLF